MINEARDNTEVTEYGNGTTKWQKKYANVQGRMLFEPYRSGRRTGEFLLYYTDCRKLPRGIGVKDYVPQPPQFFGVVS